MKKAVQVNAAVPFEPVATIDAPRQGSPGTAIALTCSAIMLYTVMDGIIKFLGGRGYPPAELLFLRSLIGIVPVAFLVWRAGGLRAVRSSRPGMLMIRALLGLAALYAFFEAFRLIPLAEAVALGFAAPLIVTALSAPLLGERVGPHRWGAVLVGFAGVLVISRPGPAMLENPGALIALAGAFCYALSLIMTRRYASESNLSVVFHTTIYGLLFSGLLVLPDLKTPASALEAALIVVLGLSGTIGLFALTRAYRLAPAASLAPFDYTGIVYATLIGYFVFAERPGINLIAGMCLIVLSAAYTFTREMGWHTRKRTRSADTAG